MEQKRPAVARPALSCASQPPSWASKGGAACVGVRVCVSVCVCVVAEYPASYFIRAPVCVALGPRPQAHLHSFLSLLPPKLAQSLDPFLLLFHYPATYQLFFVAFVD